MTRLSIDGKARKGVNLSQARAQVAAVSGYLPPRSEAEKSVRACRAASWCGAVQVGLESGGDLLAVSVGDEPHPGARNRVDHTGLDRRLGPGRIDRLRQARRARRIPPALRSGAGGAPSTISTSLTLLLCRHGRTRAALEGGSLLGPGPRYLSHVLDTVHAPPRPRCEPSGRRPGEQTRTIGPDRARGRPPGRGLLQRAALPPAGQPRLPRR